MVLYGGGAAVSLRRHLAQPFAGPAGLEPTRAWLLVALLVVLGALAWRGLRAVGPLVTTPAALSWCLSTPIDRAAWLRTPLTWLLTFSALVAGAWSACSPAGPGSPARAYQAPAAGRRWRAPGVGGGVAGASVVAQCRPYHGAVGACRPSDVVLLRVSPWSRRRWPRGSPGSAPGRRPYRRRDAALGVAVAVVGVWYARSALPHIDRAELTGGAQLGRPP